MESEQAPVSCGMARVVALHKARGIRELVLGTNLGREGSGSRGHRSQWH